MMIADMIIEFTYFLLRIIYNIVKYTTMAVIRLVKYIIKQYRIRKRNKKLKVLDIIKDENGKYILKMGG